MESEQSAKHDAFAFRVDLSGKVQWKWTSKRAGDDVANAVVQLSSADILVVGFRTEGSVAKRSITKLDFVTGKELWTATFDDDKRGSHGALEMASIQGDKLYVSGLAKNPRVQKCTSKATAMLPAEEQSRTK